MKSFANSIPPMHSAFSRNTVNRGDTDVQNASGASLDLQFFPSLTFQSEQERVFLHQVGASRLPILVAIAAFDFFMLAFRQIFSFSQNPNFGEVIYKFLCHAAMLAIFYSIMGTLHFLSRKQKHGAVQEEILLSALLALVISSLVTSATHSADDWVYAAYFLICTTAILKLRWFIGAIALTLPLAAAVARQRHLGPFANSSLEPLPLQATWNLVIAWLVGCFMGFLADSNRRQAYRAQRLALCAASKEVEEVNARITAERDLAAAQAEARGKALLAEQEREALEARHSILSMLCHEVRTPLSGCLAAAELLLETPLSDDQTELAKTVRVSGSILMSTVSSFLDLFKLEAGKPLDVVKTPLALQALVSNVQRIMDALLGDSNQVQILPPNITAAPSVVLGDPGRLCGVLLNLCTNAVKYTKKGRIQVRVREIQAGQRLNPSVSDIELFMDTNNSDLSRFSSRSGSDPGDRQSWPTGSTTSTSSLPNNASGRGAVGSEHDSVTSLGDHGRHRSTSHPSPDGSSSSAPAMVVTDEGSGWLGVFSLQRRKSLSNATDSSTSASYEEEETPAPVQTLPTDSERWLVFEVMDTGDGVPPKSLRALFKDYVQGDIADLHKPRSSQGTGLGLAICSRQVAVMGGVIGALSKPDEGSVFWFAVPLAVVNADNAADGCGAISMPPISSGSLSVDTAVVQKWREDAHFDDDEEVQEGGSSGVDAVAEGCSSGKPTKAPAVVVRPGLRVLLVEDNMINVRVAERVLKSLGADCEVAHDGRQAVDAVIKAAEGGHPYEAVLMDMIMPVMSGLEASQEIRRLGHTVPIIALTANTLEDQECLGAGMSAYLSKPVLRDQLAQALNTACPQ